MACFAGLTTALLVSSMTTASRYGSGSGMEWVCSRSHCAPKAHISQGDGSRSATTSPNLRARAWSEVVVAPQRRRCAQSPKDAAQASHRLITSPMFLQWGTTAFWPEKITLWGESEDDCECLDAVLLAHRFLAGEDHPVGRQHAWMLLAAPPKDALPSNLRARHAALCAEGATVPSDAPSATNTHAHGQACTPPHKASEAYAHLKRERCATSATLTCAACGQSSSVMATISLLWDLRDE